MKTFFFIFLLSLMATTIQSLIDQRIAEFQAQKQTIDTQISILQQQGVEYGAKKKHGKTYLQEPGIDDVD